MDRLGHRDLRQLFEYLLDLYHLRDHATCLQHLLTSLATVVPHDRASYNQMDVRQGRVTYTWSEDRNHRQDNMLPIFRQYVHEHPSATYAQRTGDTDPVKLSDFVTTNHWHRLALYQEYYRPLGVEHQLAVPLSTSPSLIIPIALNRGRRDFSERDRLVLRLLRPHLAQALRNAERVSRFHQELKGLQLGIEQLKAGVIELTPKGTIRWASQTAYDWIVCYWPDRRRANQLPEMLHRWVRQQDAWRGQPDSLPCPALPLVVDRGDRKLTVRFIREQDKRLLILEEHMEGNPLEFQTKAGLTPRECEILLWLARGKTNQEIGTILGIRPRTVAKHLERIFQKLGVETRMAAAASALDLMRS